MGKLKWYKRDPDAALNGMSELTLEERGAYNTVLDLIYSRDGHLRDDDRFIAGNCGCDIRVWRRIKSRLIELGKLFVLEGAIHNDRADVEVLKALGRIASAQDAGVASGASRRRKSNGHDNENNNLNGTTVATNGERHPEQTTTRIKKEDSPPTPQGAKTTFPSAMNMDPCLKDKCFDRAREMFGRKGWPLIDFELLWEEFTGYWGTEAPRKKRVNWPDTFYNRAKDRRTWATYQTGPPRSGMMDVIDRIGEGSGAVIEN